jgi:hypothetical protein
MATKKTALNADVFQLKKMARNVGSKDGDARIVSTFG